MGARRGEWEGKEKEEGEGRDGLYSVGRKEGIKEGRRVRREMRGSGRKRRPTFPLVSELARVLDIAETL